MTVKKIAKQHLNNSKRESLGLLFMFLKRLDAMVI